MKTVPTAIAIKNVKVRELYEDRIFECGLPLPEILDMFIQASVHVAENHPTGSGKLMGFLGAFVADIFASRKYPERKPITTDEESMGRIQGHISEFMRLAKEHRKNEDQS